MNDSSAVKNIESLFDDGNTVLILGNGFDIDLGLKTSYKDFYNSRFWPFVSMAEDYGPLGEFLLKMPQMHLWYNLEDALAKYGISRKIPRQNRSEELDLQESDKRDYDRLVNALMEYLLSLDYASSNVDSTAAKVLTAVCSALCPGVVYSFNYTGIDKLLDKMNVTHPRINHIHGSLAEKNIVLGVGDYVDLPKSVDYMYKAYNPNYKPSGLFDALETSDNIVIFGLSMTEVDYPYFQQFIEGVISGKYNGDKKKYIRIITKDNASRLNILRELREMNKGILRLMNNADFDIIMTEDEHYSKIDSMLKHLNPDYEIDVEANDEDWR